MMNESAAIQNMHEKLTEQVRRWRLSVEPAVLHPQGRLARVAGLTMEALGIEEPLGSRCLIVGNGHESCESEVVGFQGDVTFLMPTGTITGLGPGSRVIPTGESYLVPVGQGLLGRVIDGRGAPLDQKGAITTTAKVPLYARVSNPMERAPVKQSLDVGIRAINALSTIGRGQRVGLFSGSGVGKSVLLGMMTRFTHADVVVVGLVGERGREVREFVDDNLGAVGLHKAIVVAAPADHPPLLRVHAALRAMSIAEYFRDQGMNVLLLMDSLTRYAQAQREIGLAIGEPPVTKGYPPSVFAHMPALVERAGNGSEQKGGSITGIFTVLAEGDDLQDPIADHARATLDGHIVLSRDIAEGGCYPAVDASASISRVMQSVVSTEHLNSARLFRLLFSTYTENKDLISVGAYVQGADEVMDRAVAAYPRLMDFIRQGMNESASWEQSLDRFLPLMRRLVRASED